MRSGGTPKNVYQTGELTAEKKLRDRIDAFPDVPDFTYTVYQDEVYYREGSYMYRYQGKREHEAADPGNAQDPCAGP